ncbi:MAG: hypothetical protein RL160_1287 [Bacteroidota bacterium]|jgi:uncharacterized membrane protein YqaE (UPF0057 family)
MKTYVLKTGFAALTAIALLSSCASNFSLTKRRYSNGYQVQIGWFGKEKQQQQTAATPNKSVEAAPVEALNAQTQKQFPSHQQPVKASALDIRFASKQLQIPAQAVAVQTAQQPEMPQSLKPESMFSHAAKKHVKRTLLQQQTMDDNTLLYLIVAFFIPFLGVLLYEGEITNRFWISLLLTLLFWLPGFIYAALVILGEI